LVPPHQHLVGNGCVSSLFIQTSSRSPPIPTFATKNPPLRRIFSNEKQEAFPSQHPGSTSPAPPHFLRDSFPPPLGIAAPLSMSHFFFPVNRSLLARPCVVHFRSSFTVLFLASAADSLPSFQPTVITRQIVPFSPPRFPHPRRCLCFRTYKKADTTVLSWSFFDLAPQISFSMLVPLTPFVEDVWKETAQVLPPFRLDPPVFSSDTLRTTFSPPQPAIAVCTGFMLWHLYYNHYPSPFAPSMVHGRHLFSQGLLPSFYVSPSSKKRTFLSASFLFVFI